LRKCKIQIHDQLYLKYILKYLGMIVLKIHVKILSMYLKYYFKYMYFKILPISGSFGHSRSSKVIDFGTNRKRVCDFLLVRHSNIGPILHHFGDIAGFTVLLTHPIPP